MRRVTDPLTILIELYVILLVLILVGVLVAVVAGKAFGGGVPDDGALLATKPFTYVTAKNDGGASILLIVNQKDGNLVFWRGVLKPSEESGVFAVPTGEVFKVKWTCRRDYHTERGEMQTDGIGRIRLVVGTHHNCLVQGRMGA
jgi:hypothetical protein